MASDTTYEMSSPSIVRLPDTKHKEIPAGRMSHSPSQTLNAKRADSSLHDGFFSAASLVYTTRIEYPSQLYVEAKKYYEKRKAILDISSLVVLLELQISQALNSIQMKDKNMIVSIKDATSKIRKHSELTAYPDAIGIVAGITNNVATVDDSVWFTYLNESNSACFLAVANSVTKDILPVSQPTIQITCLSAAGVYVWAGMANGALHLYNTIDYKAAPRILAGHSFGPVTALEANQHAVVPQSLSPSTSNLSSNSTVLGLDTSRPSIVTQGTMLSSAADLSIKFWNVENLQCMRTVSSFSEPIMTMISISPGEMWLATLKGIYSLSLANMVITCVDEAKRNTFFDMCTSVSVPSSDSSQSVSTPTSSVVGDSDVTEGDVSSKRGSSLMLSKNDRKEKKEKKKKKSSSTGKSKPSDKRVHNTLRQRSHAESEDKDMRGRGRGKGKALSQDESLTESESTERLKRTNTLQIPTSSSNAGLSSTGNDNNSTSSSLSSKDDRSGASFAQALAANKSSSRSRENRVGIISAMVFVMNEVWTANQVGIFCWNASSRALAYVLPISSVTSLVAIGPFVYSFSVNGVTKWDVKNHKIVETLTTESSYKGTVAFEKGAKQYLWSFMSSGNITHFATPFTKHELVQVIFDSPCFCQICKRTLWSGKKEGYQCRKCKNYHCHVECLHLVLSTAPCDGPAASMPSSSSSKASSSLLESMKLSSHGAKMTPKAIAQSLFQMRQRIDPVELGDWLGTGGNEEICKEWVELLDLSSLDFEMALRRYLQSFSLPGESQKIDRLVHVFAHRYFEVSKELYKSPLFTHPDGCYVLAFSCIMLNTSLHNPESSVRFSLEQWLSSNEGLNCKSGEEDNNNKNNSFDSGFLTHLYYQLKETPLQFFSIEPSAVMQGFLMNDKKQVYCQILEGKFLMMKRPNSTPTNTHQISDLSVIEQSNGTSFMVCLDESNIILSAQLKFTVVAWLNGFIAAGAKVIKQS